MSRANPPAAPSPSGAPQDPNRQQQQQARVPGGPAQTPNVTTPKAPSVGASAPPTTGGVPANRVAPQANPAQSKGAGASAPYPLADDGRGNGAKPAAAPRPAAAT